MSSWLRPPALRPGDRVAVVAPSGPVPPERLEPGLALLRARYEVVHAPGLRSRTGYLAGEDGRRLAELRWALSDPSVQAVFCARGGYGLLRYLPALCAVPEAERRPVPVVGFSDITVLHAWAASARLTTIHGPVLTQLVSLPPEDVEALFALLEHPGHPPPLEGLVTLRPGRARGRLLGGNLELLSRLCGTALSSALRPGEPVVLLLEEIGEQPYRIDRALTQLRLSGALDEVVGVVLGDFVACEGGDGATPSALSVVVERLDALGVPLCSGAPIGHGTRNRAVPLGARVELDADAGVLRFYDGAVSVGAPGVVSPLRPEGLCAQAGPP
ncbi:MAG: LD-carboxypeptidase [Myxococcales bacterium]|nr:LD-carboxypeptidase [Myxococcota bacterium]MDW8283161.1 LD-carboxypeptidase [Myxococcales bacterium]